jgi:hypothetical protein
MCMDDYILVVFCIRNSVLLHNESLYDPLKGTMDHQALILTLYFAS